MQFFPLYLIILIHSSNEPEGAHRPHTGRCHPSLLECNRNCGSARPLEFLAEIPVVFQVGCQCRISILVIFFRHATASKIRAISGNLPSGYLGKSRVHRCIFVLFTCRRGLQVLQRAAYLTGWKAAGEFHLSSLQKLKKPLACSFPD